MTIGLMAKRSSGRSVQAIERKSRAWSDFLLVEKDDWSAYETKRLISDSPRDFFEANYEQQGG